MPKYRYWIQGPEQPCCHKYTVVILLRTLRDTQAELHSYRDTLRSTGALQPQSSTVVYAVSCSLHRPSREPEDLAVRKFSSNQHHKNEGRMSATDESAVIQEIPMHLLSTIIWLHDSNMA